MADTTRVIGELVTRLVPSLSRSLAEQFNVFRVMHHGTHEKQLSNVFAWLLRSDGSHELGDAFQRIFVEMINGSLDDARHLPTSGYRVLQEVNTAGPDDPEKDIADIVLVGPNATIAIENFESSDGHGHDFARYSAYASTGAKQGVVVLLCLRHESYRLTLGWEQAIVLTYGELIASLASHVARETKWQRKHPQQNFFIKQLEHHFTEGAPAVSTADRIAFIEAMCQTGESARYSQVPHEVAAQEFADLVALHAKRQFEDGRRTLAEVKAALKRYAARHLVPQVNAVIQEGPITAVEARFVRSWEWCVTLRRAEAQTVYLEFGPTAVVENERCREPVIEPDFTKIFLTRQAYSDEGIDRIVESTVGLEEVITGLSADDTRLRDAVLAVVTA